MPILLIMYQKRMNINKLRRKNMPIQNIDVLCDDNLVDITLEANFIWSIANKLRGVYMPDKYGDVKFL